MAKRPKWSLNAVRERRAILSDSVEYLIEELSEYPPDAYLGHDEYEMWVEWMRDMTDQEYLKEKKRRSDRRAKVREVQQRELEKLAKRLGVDLGQHT